MANNHDPSLRSFLKCPYCNSTWADREQFLVDPQIQIIGYQVHFEELTAGMFFFNHICGTTLSLRAGEFQDLYNGPIFQERMTGSEACPEFCLHKNSLDPCTNTCECAYVRDIIQHIKHWPKES